MRGFGVLAREEAPADGEWAVLLSKGGDDEEITLALALQEVGAVAFDVQASLAPVLRDTTSAVLLSQDADTACEIAEAFQLLGVTGADAFRGAVPTLDLAGALCAAARRPGIAGEAASLIQSVESGLSVRRGIQRRLTRATLRPWAKDGRRCWLRQRQR